MLLLVHIPEVSVEVDDQEILLADRTLYKHLILISCSVSVVVIQYTSA